MNTHFLLVSQPNNLGLYPYYLLKNLVYQKQNFNCKWLEESSYFLDPGTSLPKGL